MADGPSYYRTEPSQQHFDGEKYYDRAFDAGGHVSRFSLDNAYDDEDVFGNEEGHQVWRLLISFYGRQWAY